MISCLNLRRWTPIFSKPPPAGFRATDIVDQRIQSLADAKDPGSLAAIKALEDQRENAIKVALGRFLFYERRLSEFGNQSCGSSTWSDLV